MPLYYKSDKFTISFVVKKLKSEDWVLGSPVKRDYNAPRGTQTYNGEICDGRKVVWGNPTIYKAQIRYSYKFLKKLGLETKNRHWGVLSCDDEYYEDFVKEVIPIVEHDIKAMEKEHAKNGETYIRKRSAEYIAFWTDHWNEMSHSSGGEDSDDSCKPFYTARQLNRMKNKSQNKSKNK